MRKVWYIADHCVSPLGVGGSTNFDAVVGGRSGLLETRIGRNSGFIASTIETLAAGEGHTRFEKLSLATAEDFISGHQLPVDRTLLIVSTTKGNIEILTENSEYHTRLSLHATAAYLAKSVGLVHSLVVSNACISGVLALITAKRLIERRKFDHVFVLGTEVLSEFIVEGFQSLQALSDEACRPFDIARKGINLGEGAGIILLSGLPEIFDTTPLIEITGCGTSNDANHISGPSRNGDGLATAISRTLTSAKLHAKDMDAVCAHGTATIYNDEMEAKAFRLTNLHNVPVYSLKGNFGHTLGGAGVIETIIARHSLIRDVVPGTLGFNERGVSEININQHSKSFSQRRILKTASGFGGCNAALVLEKV
ncbi:MAG TPA: beta-ketoacyl synthase N-terminal-like domain-containing protein [Chryseosolibacter sp.]|nr:beta-ketoacyl synthase N-terminal-like domain-containing protein [Chryseosolibacter sp.]